MHGETTPVKSFPIFWRLVEDRLQVFDALSTSAEPEDALRLCRIVFEKESTFCDDDGDISVNKRLAIVVVQGDGNVRVGYTFL